MKYRTMKKAHDVEVETDIITLFNVLKKRKFLILIAGMLCAILILFYSLFFLKPTYIFTAVIKIGNIKNSSIEKENLELDEQIMNDYVMLLKSDKILTKVIENLELDIKYQTLQESIEIEKIPKTNNLKVSAKNKIPELAQTVVNELINIGSDYISNPQKVNGIQIIEKEIVSLKEEKPRVIGNSFLGFGIGMMLGADYIVCLAIYRKNFLCKVKE